MNYYKDRFEGLTGIGHNTNFMVQLQEKHIKIRFEHLLEQKIPMKSSKYFFLNLGQNH